LKQLQRRWIRDLRHKRGKVMRGLRLYWRSRGHFVRN